MQSLEERFWLKVDRSRGPAECWPWMAYRLPKGYGQICEGAPSRRTLLAHRVAWRLWYGWVRPTTQVLHTCDNPPCCNPAHLFLGSQLDNIADMVKKERHPRGALHGGAKLTEEQVSEIRQDYVYGSKTHGQPALARKYRVSQPTIGSLVRGETWK